MNIKTLIYAGIAVTVAIMMSITLDSSWADTRESLETVVLDVPSMHCASCPVMVEKTLKRIPGVKEVTADLNTKTATVTYDSGKTNPKVFIDALKNDIGYSARIHN